GAWHGASEWLWVHPVPPEPRPDVPSGRQAGRPDERPDRQARFPDTQPSQSPVRHSPPPADGHADLAAVARRSGHGAHDDPEPRAAPANVQTAGLAVRRNRARPTSPTSKARSHPTGYDAAHGRIRGKAYAHRPRT